VVRPGEEVQQPVVVVVDGQADLFGSPLFDRLQVSLPGRRIEVGSSFNP
jgi:hypothetical protein